METAKIRAKFTVTTITRHHLFQGVQVTLTPVFDPGESNENRQFWQATPAGKIELSISNPESAEVFELGESYYVDFVPCKSDSSCRD